MGKILDDFLGLIGLVDSDVASSIDKIRYEQFVKCCEEKELDYNLSIMEFKDVNEVYMQPL